MIARFSRVEYHAWLKKRTIFVTHTRVRTYIIMYTIIGCVIYIYVYIRIYTYIIGGTYTIHSYYTKKSFSKIYIKVEQTVGWVGVVIGKEPAHRIE